MPRSTNIETASFDHSNAEVGCSESRGESKPSSTAPNNDIIVGCIGPWYTKEG